MANDIVREGIEGNRFLSVPGFEKETTGLKGNPRTGLETQHLGQPTDPRVLAAREPFKSGIFFVKWLRLPPFFHDDMASLFRYLFEDNVKTVSGIPQNSIDRIDVTNGTVRQPSAYAGYYKESASSINIGTMERTGMPVRKVIDYWLRGLSDPKTGIKTFHGRKLAPVKANGAGTVMYVVTGASARPEDIEYACIFHEVIPFQEKTEPLSSSTIGEAGGEQILEVEFACTTFDRGPIVDRMAKILVENIALYKDSFENQIAATYLYDQFYSGDGSVRVDPGLIERYAVNTESRYNRPAAQELTSPAQESVESDTFNNG